MDFVVSYSGGKDSALALYRMVSGGHRPVALITTINVEQERSWFHGIQSDLLETVSGSMGIPLIRCESTPGTYGEAFEGGLAKARQMGAGACVFGDIDIDDHRAWDEERCRRAGIDCVLPLWQQDRESLVKEEIGAGFKALIKIVDCAKLDESFLGQTLSAQLVERIKQAGSDMCGEYGEYHTFVYDGPLFSYEIPWKANGIVDLGTHKAIDISLAE